ncbi:MAG: ATP synthase F1 subunit delta [Bryobacterales bacterium]|nr:ATP synthase F1 subunit delta [Bryobacterales bacterium]
MASALSTKYAQAVLDLLPDATETQFDEIRAEINRFAEVYESSEELRSALSSPAVPIATRRNVVVAIVHRLGLSDLVRRFLLVVVDHRRMPLIREIETSFEEGMNARLGRVTADVSVANPVSDAQREIIQARLSEATGKRVSARFKVREDLLGGFRAQIGSKVYDASVRGQIEALRHELGIVH